MTGKHLKIGVISHFFIALVLDGLQRLTGLFMLELLNSVNLNRQSAVLPFITSWAVANIVASLSGILIPSRKSESIILLGVLLTAVGAALSILTTNITTLTVFWGFIFGSGYGLSSPHLSKYLKTVNPSSSFLRATPNLGVAIMPFVFHILVSYYGLPGSYLILSGIILNYLPLALAAAYSIELPIPNIKWRVRKRSSNYFVSKQDGGKTSFNESFINSLEPDLILTISQSEGFHDDIKTDSSGSEKLFKEIIHANRKRSETRGNDLQGLPTDMRILSLNRTHSEIITEIKNYEKGRRIYEGSFSNNNVVYEGDESMEEDDKPKELQEENNGDQACHIIHPEKDLETNNKNTETDDVIESKHSIELTQDISEENSECETKRRLSKNHETVNVCSEKDTERYLSTEMQTNVPKNESLQSVVKDKDEGHVAIEVESKSKELERQNDKEISVPKEHYEKSSPPINSHSENLKITSKLDNKTTTRIPLDIKVHVVECFMTDDEYWKANLNNKHTKRKKNSYREHSNSILPGTYDNIDFTQNYSKATEKGMKLENAKLSSIYTISENTESDGTSLKRKEKNDNYTMSKIKPVFKFLNEITTPICMCIILITIIFEFNIVALITIFADFGNDIDDDCLDFKYILVSFGVGGLVGKICCCKISRTIPEKSHSIGVILFLLTGLSTAGVLFSPNLYWLAGFYCILGALEGGITYTIPKFISEHIDKNLHFKLSSVKNFLSGMAITSIPYAISLSKDDLDDYEFLLQILSCSSVFCAFLTYFLPYLSKTLK